MALQIATDKTADGAVVVRPQGEVDMEVSPNLRQALRSAFDGKPKKVVMHLKDVPYIDSSGIAVLVEGLQWSKKTGVAYVLAECSPQVKGVIDLARLSKIFTVLATLDEATKP